MFSVQNLMTSHVVLFSLYYPYLLSLKSNTHSPHQLANYYLAKVTQKSQQMRKKSRYLGDIKSHAIAALIRGESLKSVTACGILQGGLTFLKLSKEQLPTVPAKQISLYGLRLRLIMAIAALCDLDLHQSATREQLSLFMQSIPITESHSARSLLPLSASLFTDHCDISVNRHGQNKPWLSCLHFISTLTLDGMMTYRLGLKAHKQFSQRLPVTPLNIINEG